MRSIEAFIEWLQDDPDGRMIVVPGIHTRREFIREFDLASDQIIDMYSISHFQYPEYQDKVIAFYNPYQCLQDLLPTSYVVADLAVDCD